MQCPSCNQAVPINKVYCPFCGKRINADFNQIAVSVHDDAAIRRGRRLEAFLKWLIAGVIMLGVVTYGFNDLWNRPLLYDGVDLPALDAPTAVLGDSGVALQKYIERQPLPLPTPPAPRVFGYRQAPLKDQLREVHGGDKETSAAVTKALRYLRSQQEKDGGFSAKTDNLRILKERSQAQDYKWGRVGLTAMALLPFLAEGETWNLSELGRRSDHGEVLFKGLTYLLNNQDANTGCFGRTEGHFHFNHALATLAVAEAAGVSGDSVLAEATRRAVTLIENTQGAKGGWGYSDNIAMDQDTSVSSWMIQALVAARAAGLEGNPKVLEKALAYLNEITDPHTANVVYGVPKNSKQLTPSYIPVVLMLRLHLGQPAFEPIVRRLALKTGANAPSSKAEWGKAWKENAGEADKVRSQTFDPHRWYHGTYGMFFYGGKDWETWNKALVKALLELQDDSGAWHGNDLWTVKVGAVYSTSLCVLSLQVYYRYH